MVNEMINRDFLPSFLREKYQELDEHPELNERCEKITDFLWLIKKIWCISNAEYQERIWVRHEDMDKIVDSYDDTTMYFLEEGYAVLEARDEGRVEMTNKQYQVLKKFYDMVDVYDSSEDLPESDAEIFADPKWHRIRGYAKLVYEELTKE